MDIALFGGFGTWPRAVIATPTRRHTTKILCMFVRPSAANAKMLQVLAPLRRGQAVSEL